MKRKPWLKLSIAGLALSFVIIIMAQTNDPFMDSDFDGSWAGSIRMQTDSGKRDFPLILNLNNQAQTGIGFALLSNNLSTTPDVVDLYPMRDFIRIGTKISVKIDTSSKNEGDLEKHFTHTIVLSYKRSKGILTGTFKSDDPDLSTGKVFLYPQIRTKMLQKIWVGNIKINKIKTRVFLGLIQKSELEDEGFNQTSVISGFGFIGNDYGIIKKGSFDGIKFTGTLKLPGNNIALDLKLSGFKIKGSFKGQLYSSKGTLLPTGTRAKPLGLIKGEPIELVINECNTVSLFGKNMDRGVIVHVDQELVRVDGVENVTKNKTLVCLTPSENMESGQKVSVRMVGLDGQQTDLLGIFTTKIKETPITVSFSKDIQPIFNSSCAVSGCHAGSFPSQGMDLSSGAAYSNIVNVSSSQQPILFRIKPFEPENSYLIKKIKGTDINGSRMPFGRTPLSVDVIARIENWIKEGASNN